MPIRLFLFEDLSLNWEIPRWHLKIGQIIEFSKEWVEKGEIEDRSVGLKEKWSLGIYELRRMWKVSKEVSESWKNECFEENTGEIYMELKLILKQANK